MDHLAAVARKSEAGASYLFSIILVFLVLSGLVSWSVDEDILVGFWLRLWFGLEEVVSRLTSLDLSRFIRWWEGIPLDETTTRSLASAQHYHPSFPFFRHIYIILSLPTMVLIATCIYFAWSPVLARASPLFGLCCLICGWISHFTHALISRVSVSSCADDLEGDAEQPDMNCEGRLRDYRLCCERDGCRWVRYMSVFRLGLLYSA
ncbi:hypothetical protein R3P38DRAFT_3376564, partial [Favolaschia claudopus]